MNIVEKLPSKPCEKDGIDEHCWEFRGLLTSRIITKLNVEIYKCAHCNKSLAIEIDWLD